MKQTHMALGDGVELGHVAVLFLDEVGAVGHLLVAKVRAGPRVAVGLLFCGLVGIQDQHQVFNLARQPNAGERVIPVAICGFLVE